MECKRKQLKKKLVGKFATVNFGEGVNSGDNKGCVNKGCITGVKRLRKFQHEWGEFHCIKVLIDITFHYKRDRRETVDKVNYAN